VRRCVFAAGSEEVAALHGYGGWGCTAPLISGCFAVALVGWFDCDVWREAALIVGPESRELGFGLLQGARGWGYWSGLLPAGWLPWCGTAVSVAR